MHAYVIQSQQPLPQNQWQLTGVSWNDVDALIPSLESVVSDIKMTII